MFINFLNGLSSVTVTLYVNTITNAILAIMLKVYTINITVF